jgi:YjbR
MTADDFRNLALSFPDAYEHAHMGHPDFRVNNKIFASLGPKEAWGMAKLTPEQQTLFVDKDPAAFEPVKGGWGLKGATRVTLENATEPNVLQALRAAWENITAKK